jgi:hypothetical protein
LVLSSTSFPIEEYLMRSARRFFCLVGVGALAAACGGGGGNSNNNGTPDAFVPAACAPSAACTAPDKTCLGLVDNNGKTSFGLRMSELDLTSPKALITGVVGNVVAGSITPNDVACNLDGRATFSWLLQFDTTAGTLKTGGARPVADATTGYSFDDEMIDQGANTFHVQPVTFNARPDASGNFAVTTGTDLIVPIFLDAAGSTTILLPLHQARIAMGTLSSDNNCIGSYNASTLDPANSCQPDSTHPQFTTAGEVDGYMTLEEADTVIISALSQSLCVVLSGDANTYGRTDGANIVCARDPSNKIIYKGKWCSTTNAAATAGCADAEQLLGHFAASSVLIN